MNARSKTLTELSPDAEQRFLVSHETSISQMTPLCPSYVPILSPFSVYQTHGDLSFAAENSKSPSRLMRTRVSALSCPFSDNGRITCKISHTHTFWFSFPVLEGAQNGFATGAVTSKLTRSRSIFAHSQTLSILQLNFPATIWGNLQAG